MMQRTNRNDPPQGPPPTNHVAPPRPNAPSAHADACVAALVGVPPNIVQAGRSAIEAYWRENPPDSMRADEFTAILDRLASAGISQAAFAEALGKSRSTITLWKKDQRPIGIIEAIAIRAKAGELLA